MSETPRVEPLPKITLDIPTLNLNVEVSKFNFALLLFIKLFVVVWMMGIVLANYGIGNVFWAIVFPPYDLYLVIEFVMNHFHLLPELPVPPTPPSSPA